jgi:ElaB/YqjD/DUF883 family membrane-anchored ribosome-binding protein
MEDRAVAGDRKAREPAVEEMTTEEQISKSQSERDEARQDLRDTLNEVNAKVERAGDELRPDHLVESHPVGACLVAGVIGFLLGSTISSRATGPIIIAAVAGFALSIRSSSNGADEHEASERDGRETYSID